MVFCYITNNYYEQCQETLTDQDRFGIWYNMLMSDGSSIILAILAGVLPSLIWLWFWLREDCHPEPRWLLISLFFGGLVAVIASIFLEKYIAENVLDTNIRYTIWAAIEEITKFIVVAAIALFTVYNDEPIDAMVYCIVVALGFAAIENVLFMLDPLSKGLVAQSLISNDMRFIGATLVHIASSATVGGALGLVFYRGRLAKSLALIAGLVVAVVLHTIFNLSIINSINVSDALQIFAWLWGAIVILMILFEEVKAVEPRTL